MATAGHESEAINVEGLKASLQKFKTDKVDVKVNKVSGKGLSTNDYTTAEKNKLAGIAAGAEVNVQSDWNATSGDAFIKNKPTIPDSFQWFGTSSTAANTVQKEVSIPSITSLKTGQIIVVKPTATSTVANSTLKLNDFDAYPMRYNNAAITTSTDSVVWAAHIPSLFVFDGSYWVFLGHGLDSNTTYSTMSVAEGTTGTATSARTMRADYLKQIIQALAPQSDWNATSGNAFIKNKPAIPSVAQTTGTSTTAVMSQKAVSDLIPAQASASNQLADKNFVNSSVSTATAEIKGNATSACDTLGEAEALISAEKTRAQGAESTLQTNIDAEATRAQAAESTLNSGKADKATTLAGYGITDAYTKSETYTKTEVNGLVDTPHQEYVTVDAYANLPATGSKDTIYRVSNYNGSTSQVDASVYSEYAWNGSQYIFLCVKSQIGEVFDISVYNNNAKYADLTAALGTNGANIPDTLRKGGMSVKYVCSSDNKYVQYRLTADDWSTDTEDWAIADEGVYVENPEFIYVKTDKDDKILWAIRTDGNIYYGAGVPQQVVDYIEEKIAELSLDEYEDIVAFLSDYLGSDTTLKVMIDSINERIPEIIESPEFLEVTTDSEGKIISYRDSEGVKHEKVGIESPNIKVKDLEITGNLRGFDANPTDWSAHKELQIPEPRCARVNFTGIEDIPQAKFVDAHGYMEFWDMQGNYFKKEVIMNAQGSSSMGQPKKNIAIDICNNNGWDDDDTFKLRIGNWVTQDSFHLKAYNTDFFKGVCVFGYKIADLVASTYDEKTDRTWKQAILPDYTFGDSTVNGEQVDDISLQALNDARCMPDGFPCIVYLNGEFYGVYSWQIKKHRDNYHMSKSDAKHIHLDGVIDLSTLFNGSIQWNQFEIRNPKNLCYASIHYDRKGQPTFKYDADIPNGTDEIAGTDKNYDGDWAAGTYAIGRVVKHNGNYFINQVEDNSTEPVTQDSKGNKNTAKDPDFKNKTKCGWINCSTSVKVKKYIIDLSHIKSLIDAESTSAAKKAVFENYFDVGNYIDYLLVQMVIGNPDGFRKNWQWTTWDGIKWYINNYDMDFSFGANAAGRYTTPAFMTYTGGDYTIGESHLYPMSFIWDNYSSELNDRYVAIRNVVTPNIVVNLIKDWMDRIGESNYKAETTKWNPPCNKDMVLGDGWKLYAYSSYSEFQSIPNYVEGQTYSIGDKCRVIKDGELQGLVFEATKNTSAYPIIEYGHRDSFYRISNWIRNRFMYLDEYFNYTE